VIVVERSSELRRTLPALIASIPTTIVYFAVLGIVLTAAGPEGLDLTAAQTSGWVAVLYGFPTLLALVLTLRYRQPCSSRGTSSRSSSTRPSVIRSPSPNWPAPRSWRER
jgi:predicted benzoate:H+ symporter BenE